LEDFYIFLNHIPLKCVGVAKWVGLDRPACSSSTRPARQFDNSKYRSTYPILKSFFPKKN